ncbi:MAG: FecR domain-containing protein [Spirochaetes bacterium]|nr:FecR domain-containing protein [Spirochaetota bacterium]
MKRSFIAICALLSAALAFGAPAEEIIGKFQTVQGSVSLETPDGKSKVAGKVGENIAVGRVVVTAANALAELMLADGSLITVNANSKIALNKNLISPKNRKNVSFGVIMGGMKAKVNKLSGSDEFKVQTPTSVAAVRGTEFEVALGSDGSTMVAVNKGKVNVGTDGGAADVNANESSSVLLGEEKSGVKKQEYRKDSVDAFVKEREQATKSDPVGTLQKMEAKASSVGDKSGSLLNKANDKDSSPESLNDEFQQLSTANKGVKALADSIQAENKGNRNVERVYNTLRRIAEANDRLEARIAAALAKINERYAKVEAEINTRSKQLDDIKILDK